MRVTRKLVCLGLVASLAALVGCGDDAGEFSPYEAKIQLQTLVDRAVAQEEVENFALLVDAPDQDFLWQTAGGLADPTSGAAMTSEQTFRIASTTKTFTATVIMQLVEEGRLSLETPLGELLDTADMPENFRVDDLHVLQGFSAGGRITVRQLLNHTSGLRDVTFDALESESSLS